MNIFKYILQEYKEYKNYKKFSRKVRELNPKTNIIPTEIISLENISFGKYSYGNPLIIRYGNIGEGLEIGNYVSIAKDVVILLGGAHNLNTFTTFPLKAIILNKDEGMTTQKIIIEDDVWIGYGVKILSGVKIGKGAVIGAGAVVTKNLEPYGIYAGVPAKLIRYRFPKEIREKLLEIDFKNLENIDIDKNIELFYDKLTQENLNKIIVELEKSR